MIRFLFLRTGFIRITHRGDIRLVSLPAVKGEIIGISRFFPGMGAHIRRAAGAAGGDGGTPLDCGSLLPLSAMQPCCESDGIRMAGWIRGVFDERLRVGSGAGICVGTGRASSHPDIPGGVSGDVEKKRGGV
jgi:hypothetical protein